MIENAVGDPFETVEPASGVFQILTGSLIFLSDPVEDYDADEDGMPDVWELENFGTTDEMANADFDGDGTGNLLEHLAGTVPTLASSSFNPGFDFTGTTMTLTAPTTANRIYWIEFSTDLLNWTPVRWLAGTGDTISLAFNPESDDPLFTSRPDRSKYFVRIKIQIP